MPYLEIPLLIEIPDRIPIDLFLPRDQSALDGPLEFCKQDAADIDQNNKATLFSLITASPGFNDAIEDLRSRELIVQDNRYFSIHRVVQEAINFHSVGDLQDSFDTATRLVFQQFPNRKLNETLYKKWNICQEYITHGIYLRKAFSIFSRSGKLIPSNEFITLMSNCAWYVSVHVSLTILIPRKVSLRIR